MESLLTCDVGLWLACAHQAGGHR